MNGVVGGRYGQLGWLVAVVVCVWSGFLHTGLCYERIFVGNIVRETEECVCFIVFVYGCS